MKYALRPAAHGANLSDRFDRGRRVARASRSGRGPRVSMRRAGMLCVSILTMVLLSVGGCRSISGIVESRQSLDARKLSRQGLQAMHQGEWGEAEQLFSSALKVSDADDRAHRGLAEAYWNRGQLDSAIEHMEKAVKLSAGDPGLVGRLGEMYFENGQYALAERQSEIALASERNSADVWTLRGNCLQQKGSHEEALAAFHRALALRPDYLDAKLRVAELYLNNNQYDRILATLDRLDPVGDESTTPPRVHMLRGIALKNLDRPDLAIKHFVAAAESDSARAEPYLQIAAIELERGRTDQAEDAIGQAMQRDRQLVESSGWANLQRPGDTELAEQDESTPLRR